MKKFMLMFFVGAFILINQADAVDGRPPNIPSKPENSKALCVLGIKVEKLPFYVYQDGASPENKFHASGFMGDFSEAKIDLYCKDNPYSGTSCAKIIYTKKPESLGWAGLYWQFPPNNWGDEPSGYDLRKASRLTFWARGENGGEVITIAQVGGITGKYGDTGNSAIGPIILSKEWTQYTINLKYLDLELLFSRESRECWPFMEPLSRVIGGFGWAVSLNANQSNDIIFYLDEIRFEGD